MQKEILEERIRDKQEILAKLRKQNENLNDKNEILRENLDRIKEKIISIQDEVDERQKISEQLKKQQQRLKESQRQYGATDEEIKLKAKEKDDPFSAKNFQKQIKEELNTLLEKKVESLRKLRKENYGAQNRDKDLEQMFVNAVQIRLELDTRTKEDNNFHPKNEYGEDAEYITQTFRISRETTFGELRKAACQYWGIGEGYQFENEHHQILKLQMDDNTFVERFFEKNREQFTQSQAVLILKKPKPQEEELTEAMKRTAREQFEGEVAGPRIRKKNYKDGKGDRKDKMTNPALDILRRFPGLKPFYNYWGSEGKKEDNKMLNTWKTSFLVLVLLVLYLVLNLINLTYKLEGRVEYWSLNLFQGKADYSTLSAGIWTKQNVYNVLQQFAGDKFRSLPESQYKYIFPVGKFRLRQFRTKQKDCAYSDEGHICYQDEFTDETIDKSTVANAFWGTYQDISEPQINGEYQRYPGGGYIVDLNSFYYDTRPSGENVASNDLASPSYITEATKAIIFSFNFYNPSSNFYIASNLLFEFQGTAQFPHVKSYDYVYKSTDLDSGMNVGLLILDLVRLGILVFFNFIIILETLKERKRLKKCNILNAFLNQIQMLIFLALFMAYMILFYMNPSPNPQGLLETTYGAQINDQYYDLVTPGSFSLVALAIDSFLLLFVFYNIMNVFRLNRYPHVMMTTLERAITQVAIYLLLLIPILLGFSFIGWKLWGANIHDYSNINRSILSTLLLTVGITDTTALIDASPVGSVIYILVFFITVLYFVLSVFLAIYSDSLRVTLLRHGYPSMQESQIWGFKRLMLWMCAVCPNKFKKRCQEEKLDDEEEDENNQRN